MDVEAAIAEAEWIVNPRLTMEQHREMADYIYRVLRGEVLNFVDTEQWKVLRTRFFQASMSELPGRE